MTKSILVPVDLSRKEMLEAATPALRRVALPDRAKVTLVGVTDSSPSGAAHTPEEF